MQRIHTKNDAITLAEAAQFKGVTRKTVYDAIKAGRLASFYMLGKPVVSKADVVAWKIVGRRSGGPLSKTHKANISKALKRSWAKRR